MRGKRAKIANLRFTISCIYLRWVTGTRVKNLNIPIWKGNGDKEGTSCSCSNYVVPLDLSSEFRNGLGNRSIRNRQFVPLHG